MLRLFAWWEGLKHRLRDERGQSMVEYGLIIALVALAVILALQTLGGKLNSLFENINANLGSP